MNAFENKLVALVNKEIEVGVAMNAFAHMTIGLGTQLNNERLRLNDYKDKEGNVYPNISQMPFMILRGKSSEIRKAVAQAKEKMLFGVFTDTMTGGTYQEQFRQYPTNVTREVDFLWGCILALGIR